MTDRLAATAYRLLAPRANAEGTDDHDSLQNIITDPLPNGSLCWVIATEGLYRLDKLDNTTPALAGVVIIPLAGPGRWILLSSGAAESILSAEIFLDSTPDFGEPNAIVTPTGGGIWTPGPTNAVYVMAPAVSPVFTPNLTTGVLTYLGPARRYLLFVYATMASGSPLMGVTADAGGDRIPLSINDGTEGVVANVGSQMLLSAARSVQLIPNETIQAALADTDLGDPPAPTDITVRRLHLVAVPFI